MRHKAIAAFCVVILGATVWGGITFYQHRKCEALKEDFRNHFDLLIRAGMLADASQSRKLRAVLQESANRSQKESDRAIELLTTQCGSRVAQTAIREAGERMGL